MQIIVEEGTNTHLAETTTRIVPSLPAIIQLTAVATYYWLVGLFLSTSYRSRTRQSPSRSRTIMTCVTSIAWTAMAVMYEYNSTVWSGVTSQPFSSRRTQACPGPATTVFDCRAPCGNVPRPLTLQWGSPGLSPSMSISLKAPLSTSLR